MNESEEIARFSYRTNKSFARDLKLFAINHNTTLNNLIEVALYEFINKHCKGTDDLRNFKKYDVITYKEEKDKLKELRKQKKEI